MVRNFFKIAWRNLKKNKGFTAINIIGLAIGMATAMLIMLWVKSEMSFDRFFDKTDQLYIVGNKDKWNDKTEVWFSTPKPMAQAIKTEFPEVKNVTRVNSADNILLTAGEKKINGISGIFADSTFMEMFNLPLIAGNSQQALRNPTEIILTETLAKNLYETNEVIGKTIKIGNTDIFTVGAVIKDIPSNSFLNRTQYILPWRYMEQKGISDDNWNNNSISTYIEVEPSTNIENLQTSFKNLTKRHIETNEENVLKPISETWLYNNYEDGKVVGGRIEMVRVFTIIAGFILLIACINFMNLSTAQSEKRAKEVGVRKVVGAKRSSLIGQFLTESVLIAFISGILAIVIVLISLPAYSNLVDRKLSIEFSNLYFWLFFFGFILLTGILAGSYPAFFLSSFKPIKVLKGKLQHVNTKVSARKVLVITQFSIAVLLIISTLVMRRQIQYGQDREIGYNKERLIYLTEQGQIASKANLIKKALLQQGIASSVTRTMTPLTTNWSTSTGFEWEGKTEDNSIIFNRSTADDKLVETAGLTLVSGRDFDLTSFPTDSSAVILNESAVKAMGFKDPIGKIIKDMGIDWHVIGVIKDFIQESPYDPINPLVIEGATGIVNFSKIIPYNTMHIKFNRNLSTREALAKTEKIFKEYNSEYPFAYKFIDDEYALKFDESQKIGSLATLFACLTIFISCLGLFGLAAFMAENRIKEIGIRKVLGASVFNLTKMLSTEFLTLVAIACLIAFPLAYWAMDSYLTKYNYRIAIGWDIFLIAGLSAITTTILTVSYQSIKAAIANPVNSLRDE